MTQEKTIFQEIQEKYRIVEVAENTLGLKVKRIGATYRADSIAKDGGGENALALYESTNSFYDWKLREGGDIAQLVALVKFDGDIKAAIRELMPNRPNNQYDEQVKQLFAKKKAFASSIEQWHKELLNSGNPASRDALKYLLDRRISTKTISELKIGLKPDSAEKRICIPYWDAASKEVIYFTSRKFPQFRDNGSDEPHEHPDTPKYKKAPLEFYPFLHNAPLGLNTLKRKGKDGDGTIIITEGVFDWLAFYQEGYSVLATNGGDFGKYWPEVLETIEKNFRKVILAFDNDEAGREFTRKAAQKFFEAKLPFSCAEILTKDVAEYYATVGNLNTIINSAKDGFEWLLESLKDKDRTFEQLSFTEQKNKMDFCKKVLMRMGHDFSASQMHEAMLSLRNYFPRNWVSETIKEVKKLTTPTAAEKRKARSAAIVNTIANSHDIIYDERVGFYEYMKNEGRWVAKFDNDIGSYVVRLLGEMATGNELTSAIKLIKADERIRDETIIEKFNTKPLISFKNGTLYIDENTGNVTFKHHDKEDYNTVTMPYNYDPKAKCAKWLKFIEEVTNGDKEAQAILQEFPGYALIPSCFLQKCLLLKGDGANGKSVYTNIIKEVFGGVQTFTKGYGYVSSVEPSKFKDNFRVMPFLYSFINISSDTESDLRHGEGLFKKIVAGETLEDSYKHKDPIQFQTRSKLIMCCNFFPLVSDTSNGFMRRFLIVDFPMHYVDDPRPNTNERQLIPFMEKRFMDELPGIFNWILEGLRRLIRNGKFTGTDSKKQKALIREFRSANDPMYTYLEEEADNFFDESGEGKEINRSDIFKKYIEWAIEHCINPIAANRFYNNFRSVLRTEVIEITIREVKEDGRKRILWKFRKAEEKEIAIAA